MTGEILQGSIPVLCLGHIQLAGDERSGSIRSFVGDGGDVCNPNYLFFTQGLLADSSVEVVDEICT